MYIYIWKSDLVGETTQFSGGQNVENKFLK